MRSPTPFLVAGNTIPLLHLVAIAAPWCSDAWEIRLLSPLALWVAPPLLRRFVEWVRPVREGRHDQGTSEFRSWYVQAQLQVLYLRAPFLEEILRVFPGVYGLWLRAWGSQVHPATYWAPGSRVMDRQFLSIAEPGVLVGTEAILGTHLLEGVDGRLRLTVGRIALGAGCTIGARAMLAPGVTVEADECVGAGERVPPFHRWIDGHRRAKGELP
jgi:hypothetical protein